MAQSLEFALISRLREVLGDRPATETDLRSLLEQGEGWQRALNAQIDGSERRLEELTARPETPLHEIAAELRRVEMLRPQLEELELLLAALERRARELRTEWLARQAGLSTARPR
jgi:chromosome segregation ATPase